MSLAPGAASPCAISLAPPDSPRATSVTPPIGSPRVVVGIPPGLSPPPKSTTLSLVSARAMSTKTSMVMAGSLLAAVRLRSSAATPRYSSMCMGDALSHARNAARSVCGSGPARWAANQSEAIRVMAARMCGSDMLTGSAQPRHASATVGEGHSKIFLHHVRRHSEPLGDLLVTQAMLIFQVDGGAALGRQLSQDFP